MRVLVVDDEPAFVGPLAQRLSLRGMDVRTAHDAREALFTLQAWPAELVFLDVGLPGMDGVALLKLLREFFFGNNLFDTTAEDRQLFSDRGKHRSHSISW